jgi:hypothetical protein
LSHAAVVDSPVPRRARNSTAAGPAGAAAAACAPLPQHAGAADALALLESAASPRRPVLLLTAQACSHGLPREEPFEPFSPRPEEGPFPEDDPEAGPARAGQGSDPAHALRALAVRRGAELRVLAAASGGSPAAEAALEVGAARGEWLMIQNLHVAPELAAALMEQLQVCELLVA